MFFSEYLWGSSTPKQPKWNISQKPYCNLKIRKLNHPKQKDIPTSIKRPQNSKLKPWGCFSDICSGGVWEHVLIHTIDINWAPSGAKREDGTSWKNTVNNLKFGKGCPFFFKWGEVENHKILRILYSKLTCFGELLLGVIVDWKIVIESWDKTMFQTCILSFHALVIAVYSRNCILESLIFAYFYNYL